MTCAPPLDAADVLRACATVAGFTTVDVLPVRSDPFRFYRLARAS